jgi:sugar lactone lactonase YvrE
VREYTRKNHPQQRPPAILAFSYFSISAFTQIAYQPRYSQSAYTLAFIKETDYSVISLYAKRQYGDIMSTTIKVGPFEYEWIENWSNIPRSSGFAHHGIAIGEDGNIYIGDISEPRIHVVTPDGTLLRSWSVPVTEVHGLSFGTYNDQTVLWVVDTGSKGKPPRSGEGAILASTLDGEIICKYGRDDLGYTQDEGFSPTACAQDPATGNLWITDGYGSSRVHCLTPDGKKILGFDGTESECGKFKTPHWIWVDQRQDENRIYIADRANHRVLIFTPEGKLLQNLNEGFNFPSGFASFGDVLIVAELSANVVVLDNNDEIIGHIGTNREAKDRPGWPNAKDDNDKGIAPTQYVKPGLFNSPHGIAADKAGNIYVSEWLFGGRYIRLKRQH